MTFKTIEEVRLFLSRITYKPNWKFELIQNLDFGLELHVTSEVQNSQTIEHESYSRTVIKSMLLLDPSEEVDPSEEWLIANLRKLLFEIEMHERDEWLKLDGKHLFAPHEKAPMGLEYYKGD